ncbi:MAG: LuxR C-terminal-related transcriptional regulator [Gammaproteobacteria bacterium]|jgi:DNA-binding CsgD family transcriptional regulator
MEGETRQRVHVLWDGLAEFGAARINEALEYLLTGLLEPLGAQHAWWMGAVRLSDLGNGDPALGWRTRVVRHLANTPERRASVKEHLRRIDQGNVDPQVVANVRDSGRFRINISHEMVPADWWESEFYNALFRSRGIQDVIYVATPLGDDVESWFAFERISDQRLFFDETDREVLDYAMRSQKWFHRQLVLHHGVLLADKPLTSSERKVLNGLLTDKSEQEIASELALSPSTVHTYSKRICRKFNVRGRAGLAALWLGQMPED